MKPAVSIIFVYYNTPNEIVDAVKSIPNSIGNVRYEIIVVDNASSKQIPSIIIKNKNVKIIKNDQNYGYGKALNQGVKRAFGKYILLVNSDTQFNKNAIKDMVDRVKKDNQIGVLGPLIVNKKGKILQSISGMPFLPRALVVFSFLKNFFPFNHIYKKYHNYNLNRNREQTVDVVGGVCILVKKSVFEKAGGFDERFFMYFEEADFCYRVKKLGFKILFYPNARVIHLGSRSMQDKEWIEKTFEKNRFSFFVKYHGIVSALSAEALLRLMKSHYLFLVSILGLSLLFSLYRINELMPFIGDQGWFYISARDFLTEGIVPLVGIPSSRPWLHQGPLWTYALSASLWLFNFNPVGGAYLTAFIGVFSIIFIYVLGSTLFTRRIGILAALLYSTSPLIIIYNRFPYHTSAIPLFTILLILAFYKWIKGRTYYFSIVMILLAILYNLEISTSLFWFIIFPTLIYGILKKRKWGVNIFQRRIIFFSMVGFLIPMIPMITYDLSHGFKQTGKFLIWLPYRFISFFGYNPEHTFSLDKLIGMLSFLWENYKKLVFIDSNLIAISIGLFSFGYFLFKVAFRRNISLPIFSLFLFLFIPLGGIIFNQTPSDAYLPILFPQIILITVLFFDHLMTIRYLRIVALIMVIGIFTYNTYSILKNSFFMVRPTLQERILFSKKIISLANNQKYNIIGEGPGSEFESFTMNYKYLTWWLGKGESEKKESLRFIIKETSSGIILTKHEAISK